MWPFLWTQKHRLPHILVNVMAWFPQAPGITSSQPSLPFTARSQTSTAAAYPELSRLQHVSRCPRQQHTLNSQTEGAQGMGSEICSSLWDQQSHWESVVQAPDAVIPHPAAQSRLITRQLLYHIPQLPTGFFRIIRWSCRIASLSHKENNSQPNRRHS